MPMMFTAPVLTFSRLELNPGFKNGEQGLNADLHFHHSASKLDNQNAAIVAIRLQINQKDEKKIQDAPFWLEVEYAAQFSWTEDMAVETIDNYLRTNASAVLIGYIRPLVAALTSASPLPTYTLPFINVVDLFKAATGKET